MVSIRHYMDIVEDASASLLSYGRVTTPLGDGGVLKIAPGVVYVELGNGEVKHFRSNEVKPIDSRRRTDMPNVKTDFSIRDLDAGLSTPMLK
jgi:hypothetical protein